MKQNSWDPTTENGDDKPTGEGILGPPPTNPIIDDRRAEQKPPLMKRSSDPELSDGRWDPTYTKFEYHSIIYDCGIYHPTWDLFSASQAKL